MFSHRLFGPLCEIDWIAICFIPRIVDVDTFGNIEERIVR
jgi:hypothetical protein